jgi:hypothetical protein
MVLWLIHVYAGLAFTHDRHGFLGENFGFLAAPRGNVLSFCLQMARCPSP